MQNDDTSLFNSRAAPSDHFQYIFYTNVASWTRGLGLEELKT